jgi:hypothetical protein
VSSLPRRCLAVQGLHAGEVLVHVHTYMQAVGADELRRLSAEVRGALMNVARTALATKMLSSVHTGVGLLSGISNQ